MNVLFIAHCNDLSGANKSFISLIEQLKEKINIVVLCNQEKGALTEYLNKIGIKVIFAKYSWWYTSGRKNLLKKVYRKNMDTFQYRFNKLSESTVELLKNEHFDIIYSNTSTIDVGVIIAKKLDIPHVWHIREFGKEDFDFIPIVPLKYQKDVFMSSDRIIVISKALSEKYTYIPKEKLRLVYNGFETDKLMYIKDSYSFSDKINILVSGQVCSGKGQEQAILAVDKLNKKNVPIELYIAGDIDYTYLTPIINKIGGEKEWLHILGMVKDMYNLRKDMDIELVCSRSEAFGRVTLEAMLHSIPVIGSRAGGTPELIDDYQTGLLFDYNNIEQLVICIEELINNHNLYDYIIKNAREFAKKYTIQNTADKVYRIFCELGVCENEYKK